METKQLDCGHAPDAGAPYNGGPENGGGMGWQFVVTDDGRKLCHACADMRVLDCGHNPSKHEIFTTGYGADAAGKTACYKCCADNDRRLMIETGKHDGLYLCDSQASVGRTFTVQNWPGTLCFPVHHAARKPRGGGFGAQRTDAYFTGPDGGPWVAVNRGDMQLARCRRLAS